MAVHTRPAGDRLVLVPPEPLVASLEDLSTQLMAGEAGVQSVAWEHPKRERA